MSIKIAKGSLQRLLGNRAKEARVSAVLAERPDADLGDAGDTPRVAFDSRPQGDWPSLPCYGDGFPDRRRD